MTSNVHIKSNKNIQSYCQIIKMIIVYKKKKKISYLVKYRKVLQPV